MLGCSATASWCHASAPRYRIPKGDPWVTSRYPISEGFGVRQVADSGASLPGRDDLVVERTKGGVAALPRDDDVAALGGGHLDPGVPGRDLERSRLRRQHDRRVEPLVPRATYDAAAVEEQRVARAGEVRLWHRVAGGVLVARVPDLHPQHQHVVRAELVAGFGVAVQVVVLPAGVPPPGGVAAGEHRGQAAGRLSPRGVLVAAPGQVVVRGLTGLQRPGELVEVH